MTKSAAVRWRPWAVVCACVVAVAMPVPAMHTQERTPSSTPARKRMAQAVNRTLKEGLDAQLPPHLSTLLGLTKEQQCPVRQGVVRSGKQVRGLDVSKANNNDVVLFVVDETTSNQTLYLSSKDGVLRKVVKVEAGEGLVQKITADDRAAFEREKQFWVDRLAPVNTP